jgi:RimJ/RimL family protein N-acetyltransferase
MKFILRQINEEDAKSISENLNDKDVVKYLSANVPFPYSLEDAKKYIEAKKDDKFYKGIEVDKKIVGMVSMTGKEWKKSLGYWLGKKYWGQKIMTKAAAELIDEAFSNPELIRIEASVYPGNPASAKILLNLGFKEEGYNRKCAKRSDGKIVDARFFGLLREDWKS